jgi:hypothetical protein
MDWVARYSTGEVVVVGDEIRSPSGNSGTVKKVIEPGSQDSLDFSCPEDGGILIEEMFDEGPALVLEMPGTLTWEEVTFVRRCL